MEKLDNNQYHDDVVAILLNFLSTKMNSENEIDHSCAYLDYPGKTVLGSLYDCNQVISLSMGREDVDLLLLDNNKLLSICTENPDYEDNLKTYFSFYMYTSTSDLVLRVTKDDNGMMNITIANDRGVVVKCSCYKCSIPETAIGNETPLTQLLRPVSLEQLYERGCIDPNKKGKKKKGRKK